MCKVWERVESGGVMCGRLLLGVTKVWLSAPAGLYSSSHSCPESQDQEEEEEILVLPTYVCWTTLITHDRY